MEVAEVVAGVAALIKRWSADVAFVRRSKDGTKILWFTAMEMVAASPFISIATASLKCQPDLGFAGMLESI